MNSGYFYGREQVGEVSLLLKQLKIGQRRILFALIGVGVSKDWVEYLSRWFYQKVSSVEIRKSLKILKKVYWKKYQYLGVRCLESFSLEGNF